MEHIINGLHHVFLFVADTKVTRAYFCYERM